MEQVERQFFQEEECINTKQGNRKGLTVKYSCNISYFSMERFTYHSTLGGKKSELGRN